MGLKKKAEFIDDADGQVKYKRERDTAQFISELSNSDRDVKRSAIRQLASHESSHSLFLERLLEEDDPVVIEALFSGLEQGISEDDIAKIILLLKSEQVQLRNGAIELLQQHPLLFAANVNRLMEDDDPDIRIFCVDIIGVVAHKEARNWLHHIVLNESNENVVGTALDKLAEIADESTLGVLDKVQSRFQNHAYIGFVISLIRTQLESSDE